MTTGHNPIVHHAPGTDPANPPAPLERVHGPIVHHAPTPAAESEATISHGQPVAEVYDALEAEAKKRYDAENAKPDEAAAKDEPNPVA